MCNSLLGWAKERFLRVSDRLATSGAIRKQLLFYMFTLKIESQVRRSYERRLVHGAMSLERTRGNRADNADESTGSSRVAISGAADGTRTTGGKQLWQFKVAPYPDFDRSLLLRYEQLENVVMSWALMKCLLFELIPRSLRALFDTDDDGLLLGMEPACLVPGKLFMHEVLRKEFTIALTVFLLGYRLTTRYLDRPYAFSAFDFVLQDVETIDQFLDQFEEANIRAEKEGYEQLNAALDLSPFSDFMCFKLGDVKEAHRQGRLQYQLRPNRTREAHSWLAKIASRVALAAFGAQLAWVLLIAAIPTACTLMDFSYLHAYNGCDPGLRRHYESDASHRWYHVTLSTPHRVITALADALETFVLYAGIGTIIVFLFALPFIMNEDLMKYLRRFNQEIEDENETRRNLCYRDADRLLSAYRLNLYGLFGERGLSLVDRNRKSSTKRGLLRTGQATMEEEELEARLPVAEVDVRLRALRSELRDFFKQVASVGLLVSDVISFGLLNWLFSCMLVINAAITHYVEHSDFIYDALGISLPTVLYTFLPCCALPTSYICGVIFRVYTRSLVTYHRLSSLFAYSQGSRLERSEFCEELIEYYTYQQRNCYKLFHVFPFKATSYLSLIGWTFSLLAVLSNLVHKRSGAHLE